MYQHYSFDLWMTLIKSNPSFKTERAKIFHSKFNFAKKTLVEIEHIFRQIDTTCNTINEKVGKNIDAEEMYLLVIAAINNYDLSCMSDIHIHQLYHDMENLVMEYPPVFYSSETPDVLAKLKENASMSLLSNTGFIKGQTLRKVLKNLGVDAYLNFQLYSDETGYSKPNPQFFQLLLDSVESLGTKCLPSDILHVGDNPIADAAGAQQLGINHLLINSNAIPISKLLN